MSDYDFIIDGMRWSFSRLNSFHSCPYAWKKQYIDCENGEQNAMAEYGTLMHQLLEGYAKGEIDRFELPMIFADKFDEYIPHEFPPNQYVDLRESYYEKGLAYLNDVNLELERYNILGVEKEVNFEIDGSDVVGYIDLLLQDNDTGEITVFDHKSATLKFKRDGKISKTDAEHYDQFKKQLYLYSKPVLAEYGKVDYLAWNLFKQQTIHKIPFNRNEYEESLQWAADTIKEIKEEMLWLPKPDYFFCHNICNYRDSCEYKD